MDEFEQRLQRQPLRPVPPDWECDILAAARGATHEVPSPVAWWREWLWPSPVAWGAVAACWLVILGLHLAAGPARETVAQRTVSSRNLFTALLEQRRLLAELETRPTAPVPARRPQPGPGPSSELHRRVPEDLPC